MEFRFDNLGPIKEASIELNDLTLITGNNNSGKTYLVYLIYFVLRKTVKELSYTLLTEIEKPGALKNLVNTVIRKGSAVVTNDILDKIKQQIDRAFVKEAQFHIGQAFNTSKNNLKNLKLSVSIVENFTVTALANCSGLHHYHIETINDKTIITNPAKSLKGNPSFIATVWFYDEIIKPFISRAFIFTSERLGISLFYRDLDKNRTIIFEQLQRLIQSEQNREPINDRELLEVMSNSSSRYSFPISQNIEFIREMYRHKNKSSSLKGVAKIVSALDEMIGGKIVIEEDILQYVSDAHDISLDFHACSSSIRELSDFYIYIKHLSRPGDLVIIDEPESHLSPNNQIKFTRILALCVSAGIRVLITTHSDYVLREVNNLILLKGTPPTKKNLLKKKYGISESMLISINRVNEYLVEDQKASLCSKSEYGIENKFINSCIQIQSNLYNELI